MSSRAHFITHFHSKKHISVVQAVSSGDKAYPKIRCEDKLADGALKLICSEWGVVR